MRKTLDQKLAAIHADPSGAKDFILADAKDADMAFGIGAPGLSPERHDGELRYKTLAEYRQQIREVIGQGIVDIMLMSTSTSDQLTLREGLFDHSAITPATRANDTTDVHLPRGGQIHTAPARPFRTANIDHMQCGKLECAPEERLRGSNLGLYSVTFNNQLELDLPTLERYKEFREEAERKGFRHFLEVFDPNMTGAVAPDLLGGFINDLIARTLAGVPVAGRPVFLKIVYHGPKAMEELVRYDPHLVVGVLGGAAGTTYDAFKLLGEAKKYGARAALFGRKINNAENQLAFIEFLRLIADGVLTPEEAVPAYHAVLQKLGVKPHRDLKDDLILQTAVMSYGGAAQASVPAAIVPAASSMVPTTSKVNAATTSPPAKSATVDTPKTSAKAAAPINSARPSTAKGPSSSPSGKSAPVATPDFKSMTPQQRYDYHRERLRRQFGG